jgi:hypothetical protein
LAEQRQQRDVQTSSTSISMARAHRACPGLSEIDSMPSAASQSAKSGWSLGPWPQMPTYLPVARQAAMAREISALTAGSRSSKSSPAAPARSRSSPSVSCVRSFEPIDMPSKCSRNWSARMALLGTSHIMISRRPLTPRFRPRSASISHHALGLAHGAHEGHHDLDVGQPHVVAHALERLALHREGVAELAADVAAGAAKAEHRVLFIGLVAACRRSACGTRCS